MADGTVVSGPRDAEVMEAILKEMGVSEYDPMVVHQMLEFTYSAHKLKVYCSNIVYAYRVHHKRIRGCQGLLRTCEKERNRCL